MKLLRVGPPGAELPALLEPDGTIRDASVVAADYDSAFFGAEGVEELRQTLLSSPEQLPVLSADGTRTGAPIARPPKIVCIGLNYADHAAESGNPVPSEPTVFMKATNTVVGPYDDVLIPRKSASREAIHVGGASSPHGPPGAPVPWSPSTKTDWEVELGVVLGRSARYLASPEEGLGCVAGYCVSNDVSEREFQLERGGQWVKGKSCETFNPLGPWLVTADEVADPQDLRMVLTVNGETMQDGSTRSMVFGVGHLIWYLSQFMVLEPGDLLNTGTPAGVGMGKNPQRFLRSGDVMELEIEGLGRQRLPCLDA